MSEKIWGHVTGQGKFENRGQEPQGHPKRAQKILENEKVIGSAIARLFSVWARYGASHTGSWHHSFLNFKMASV